MNIEELKVIVAGKPEGATHFDTCTATYWHNSSGGYYLICEDGTTTCNAVIGKSRSLSDIETIIKQADEIVGLNTCFDTCYDELTATRDVNDELEKEIAELTNRTVELEETLTELRDVLESHYASAYCDHGDYEEFEKATLVLAKGESK